MAVYFIADTHFGHTNVIRLCNRPFTCLDEMHRIMVVNWNARVKNNDDIYIIGDLYWHGNQGEAIELVKRLNGQKHLIIGNHDRKYLNDPEYRELFVEVMPMHYIAHYQENIIMCHYPMVEWNGYHRGAYHIYGHIHNRRGKAFEFLRTEDRALNAGADINQFMPVTFQELIINNGIFKNSNDNVILSEDIEDYSDYEHN